ncbi:unnamed protein product [Rotaria magnacalcarata]|uniref:NELL2-like EGF domain-containing protein n=1 Tax=Rotaria magnacalcarata TaxID=392030 RepID=A0A816QYQ5_9BILA|nr:unnamed protein product [Rotaria magnacalcarata]
MVLHGRLVHAWLPLLVILLQAFQGSFAKGCCSDNNGGCGKNALCSENRKTSAIKCTCKTGYTNTLSKMEVVVHAPLAHIMLRQMQYNAPVKLVILTLVAPRTLYAKIVALSKMEVVVHTPLALIMPRQMQ